MKRTTISNDWLRRATQLSRIIEENGFLARLMFPILVETTSIYIKPLLNGKRIFDMLFLKSEMRSWRERKEEILKNAFAEDKTTIDDLGFDAEQIKILEDAQQQKQEVVIAEVDQDGIFLSHFGPIKDLPCVPKEQFVERNSVRICLVLVNGSLCISKDYRGKRMPFMDELKALHMLKLKGCNVPSIIDIDFDKCVLYLSFILGNVLQKELAKQSALLDNREVNDKPACEKLSNKEKRLMRIQEGQRKILNVVDHKFIEDLFAELKKIHSARFIWNDIEYGNILIEKKSKRPFLIDFERARYFPSLNKSDFSKLRDKDIELFNLHFGTEYLTRRRLKEQIKTVRKQKTKVYAPIYFGAGLWLGDLWDIQTGYGRWNYILKNNLPSPAGKRILDLGANNAHNSIQLLRNGAREVVAIEMDDKQITLGQLQLEGFEWIDNAKYNLQYIHSNMNKTPNMNLGKFDMVMALCSLYYLTDEEMAEVVQYISTITDVFVLQCNTGNLERSNTHLYEKASMNYAITLMKNHGFPEIRVITHPGYYRPLVIGKKSIER